MLLRDPINRWLAKPKPWRILWSATTVSLHAQTPFVHSKVLWHLTALYIGTLIHADRVLNLIQHLRDFNQSSSAKICVR